MVDGGGLAVFLECHARGQGPVLTQLLLAGVAAGFNAPIAGVFFAVESVLQRTGMGASEGAANSSGVTVAAILLASVLAALVSQAGLGNSPAFRARLPFLHSRRSPSAAPLHGLAVRHWIELACIGGNVGTCHSGAGLRATERVRAAVGAAVGCSVRFGGHHLSGRLRGDVLLRCPYASLCFCACTALK